MSNAKTYSRETAVIFLAGFLGVPGEFAAVREHLPLPSLEILPEDLLPAPPDGDTPPPDFCFREARRRLREIIAGCAYSRVCVYGYSMGGRLALYALFGDGPNGGSPDPREFRKDWPKVSSLVLESAGTGIQNPEERARRYLHDTELARKFAREFSPELMESWYRQPVFAGLSPALRENLLRKRRNLQGTTAAAVLRGFSTGLMPCLLPALSAPPVPVLLLSGERDPKYTALFQEIHGPGIARITVPAAGHNIHDELPEKTAALIAGFAAG
ncbi:alpha/beta fold hydrolase [Succinimonas amylolytica]|uniref:alpha/beta fold hydrolase n=1 Tax=Succinimonas amylolytica TaxID=83769 RepID=UPI00037F83E9|nr:alpha/beta fold hydrolase [Succinimonas amylolytica]